MPRRFYGWWVTAAAFVTFGIALGVPYYNISFFYDYFQSQFGWQRADITLGFPLAAVLTLWLGPLTIHRFSPRKLIMAGTACTAAALCGFGFMSGSLRVYYALWIVYMLGYIWSGSIPHQLLVSHWFRRNRGKAMGILFAGVGLVGALGSFLVTWLTHAFSVHVTFLALAALMFVTWPVAIFVLQDKPSDIGQYPDGDPKAPSEAAAAPATFGKLLSSWPFWLLLIGSSCSIGAIGAINFHMKFVFLDQGFRKGLMADSAWRTASVLILWSSVGGRLLMGGLADRFSKKAVMLADYVLVTGTIPLLLLVRPGSEASLYSFAVLFGFGMGADYMLIPLMAAEQFGLNNLARVMGIVVPVTIAGQSWFPYFVSLLRDELGNYSWAMGAVLAASMIGTLCIATLPRRLGPGTPAGSREIE